jgi:N-ethylmaleimide reductase
VTEAVHQTGGHIFIQLMHTGRVTHPDNLPSGARSVAPSAIQVSGEMYTDANGMQTMPAPHAMSKEEILQAQDEYVKASTNAIKAGFDGVELHGANGYLLNQFISPISNTRTDEYGGSVENRCRFAIETAQKVVDAIGGHRTGIRVSPYGVFNDMGAFDGIDETYSYLVEQLSDLGLVYLHTVDHSAMGAPEVPESIQATLRKAFKGTFIRSGGLDSERAEALLNEGKADLVAFGRPFISNPDLVTRMQEGVELSDPDPNTFYTPGEKGYTDYARAQQDA